MAPVKLFLLGTSREGSTRLAKKMVRPFADTSLHEIQLEKFEELMEEDIFSGVGMAINKNDKTLWEMTKKSKVPIIERSDESVTGLRRRSEELHFLQEIDADYIMWVNGCLPFLKTKTIKAAAEYFIKNHPRLKSMTSVKEKYNWYWDSATKRAINNLNPKNVSTQKSPPLLETVHAFHIFSRKHLLENDSYWNLETDDPYLYTMDDEVECLDIDNKIDFEVCTTVWNLKKKSKKFEIGGKIISDKSDPFFIAEIGINHNGSLETAKKLIDMAKDAGADAVKFQKRTPEVCVPEKQKNVMKQTPWGEMTYLEYKKRIEFGEKEYKEIDEYCKEKGILWFASPWDIESVNFLEKFNIPLYKIASAKLTDKDLLMKIKKTGKPVLLSTGGSTIDQIRAAVSYLEDSNYLVILHCNSCYPSPDDELNLKVINQLKREFPDHLIGYSGHESGIITSCIAYSLGANVIERHITLDKEMWGSDQAASIDEVELKELIKCIKKVDLWLGDGVKKVYDIEKEKISQLRDVDNI